MRRQGNILRICPTCGNSFWVWPADIQRGKGVFCSISCVKKKRRPLVDRLWERVEKTDGCWLWTGHCMPNGYGRIEDDNGRTISTHRATYALVFGEIPEGMCVLHQCDINYPIGDLTYRRCVRPGHLRLGTHQDNIADCMAKGRHAKGEKAGPKYVTKGPRRGLPRLSTQEKIQICHRFRTTGIGKNELAADVGISRKYLNTLLRRYPD